MTISCRTYGQENMAETFRETGDMTRACPYPAEKYKLSNMQIVSANNVPIDVLYT